MCRRGRTSYREKTAVRVCFVTPNAAATFFPELESVYGGSETQTYHNSVRLATYPDMDVHVIANGPPEWLPRVARGVTVHFTPIQRGLRSKLALQRSMRAVDADVYIQQGIGSVTKEVAFHGLVCRRRFVYWAASDFDIDPAVGRTDLNRNRWFEWGMRRADLRVAQTEHQSELFREILGRGSVLVRNAFPAREPSRLEREFILWVGRFVPVKRPELFVELARRIPRERFVMIAPPPPGDEPGIWYEKQAAQAALVPNLDHIPGIPPGEIDSYFDRAKIFVNTSATEGFPNTFVQAMWAGTPLASLDFDPDGLIAGGGLGVGPAEDFDGFTDAVRILAADEERRVGCSQAAYATAKRDHDVARNMDSLVDHLKQLIES